MTPHIWVPEPWTDAAALELPSQTLHHLARVLRLSDGARLSYTDGTGTTGEGVLSGRFVTRGEETSVPRSAPLEMAVAPPHRVERVRFLVEKLTELGVTGLVWVKTQRSQKAPPPEKKVQNWVIGALEQSRRAWAPTISGPVALDELEGPLAVAQPGAPSGGWDELALSSAMFVVGPEGGLTATDLESINGRQVAQFGLGRAILRTETAVLAIAASVRAVRGWSD
ncbi:MAG: RsmE family RNA methyltransferase [Acidimicrobiia bacterium]|nr:RsmE family RNA methyltransferase [Acidimicrobiia bacterium]